MKKRRVNHRKLAQLRSERDDVISLIRVFEAAEQFVETMPLYRQLSTLDDKIDKLAIGK